MRLLFCDLLAIRDKRICKACSCPVVPGNLNVFLQPKNKTNQQKQMGKKKSKQREKKKKRGEKEKILGGSELYKATQEVRKLN